MNATTKLTLTAVIGIFALLFASPLAAGVGTSVELPNELAVDVSGDQQTDWWPCLNPAGTWLGSNELGLTYLGTIIPLDRWHRRLSIVFDGANDPTLGGFFPTAVEGPAVMGELVKTGHGTYDTTMMTYAVDETYAIVAYGVISGTIVMNSETNFDLTMYMSFFSPDQDPFGEEPPLYGCMGPVMAAYTKLPILPPCEP